MKLLEPTIKDILGDRVMTTTDVYQALPESTKRYVEKKKVYHVLCAMADKGEVKKSMRYSTQATVILCYWALPGVEFPEDEATVQISVRIKAVLQDGPKTMREIYNTVFSE